MSGLLTRWVAFWGEEEAPWSLGAVRLLLGLAVLGDLLQLGVLGLVEPLMTVSSEGGLVAARTEAPWLALTGGGAAGAWALYGGLVTTSALVAVGLGTRWAALGFVVLSAQFAWMLPGADRGIDTLIRNTMLLLACSEAGAALSVSAWWRARRGEPVRPIPAWPRRLLLLQLVALYGGAGVQKYAQQWWPWGDFAALWVIWHDWPMSAVADAGWLDHPVAWRFSQLATATTIAWEVSFPLLLVVWWLRRTGGGRLRALAVRWPLVALYAGLGVLFHLGIAVWLQLGVFPWAMLALYPAFVPPERWPVSLRGIVATDLSTEARVPETTG
jgi:hypothetical protein